MDRPTYPAGVLTRRPACGAALCLMAGILAHRSLAHQPWCWIAAMAGLSAASLIASGVGLALHDRALIRWLNNAMLAAAVFCAGTAAAQLDDFYYPADHVSRYAGDQQRLAELELRLDDPPRLVSSEGHTHAPPRQTALAQVLRVKTWDGWRPASGRITVQFDQVDPRLEQGQHLAALGRLERPSPAQNPGQFDWAEYYRGQHVLVTFTVPRAENVHILTPSSIGPLEWLRLQARRLLAEGFTQGQRVDHALLRAILLGDNDPQLRDTEEQFRRTGAAYELSVSGLHLAILAGLVYLVCRVLCLRPRTSAWIMLGFTGLYGCMTLPAPPMLRSVMLCAAFGIGILLGRTRERLQLLGLSVLALLIIEPLDLYSFGFQLGLVTILGLMLLVPRMVQPLTLHWDQDRRIASAFYHPGRWQGIWLAGRRMLVDAAIMALIAWIVSAPLILYYFDQLNIWSIPSGLVLMPMVLLSLTGGLLKIVLTLVFPWGARMWAVSSAGPVAVLRHAVALLAHLPRASMVLGKPPLWAVLGYYAILCVSMLAQWRREVLQQRGIGVADWPLRRWLSFLGPLATAVLLLAIPVAVGAGTQADPPGTARITLLSIGAGQTCVAALPSGKVYLFDDGSSSVADPLRTCLTPFLHYHGQAHIAGIFLSHPDYDHISAAADTADAYDVRDIYISTVFREQCQGDWAAQEMLQRFDAAKRNVHLISAGEMITLDEQTQVQVLWPPAGRTFSDTNNSGEVVRLVCRGHSILFPADIQTPTERELSAHPAQIASEVLVAPHHGSAEISTAAFVAAVNPTYVLSSNAWRLTHKQQIFEQDIGARPLYRTNRCGALSVVIDTQGQMRIETFLPTAR